MQTMENMIGQKFGRLLVVNGPIRKLHRICFECICDCGNKVISISHNLRHGRTKSCGCLLKEIRANANLIAVRKRFSCRICGTTNPDRFYDRMKTICAKCKVKLRTEQIKNDPILKAKRSEWSKRNQQKSPETFIKRSLGRVKRDTDRYKQNDIRKDWDIDIKYVLDLWKLQQGKCKITGIQMTHQYNSLRSISIDRIDSNKGHIHGNIQLICKALNLAKGRHDNNELIEFIRLIRTNQN
jgi:hypothetical protein